MHWFNGFVFVIMANVVSLMGWTMLDSKFHLGWTVWLGIAIFIMSAVRFANLADYISDEVDKRRDNRLEY